MEDLQVILYILFAAVALIGGGIRNSKKQKKAPQPVYKKKSQEYVPEKEVPGKQIVVFESVKVDEKKFDQLGEPFYSYEYETMEDQFSLELSEEGSENQRVKPIKTETIPENFVSEQFKFGAGDLRKAFIFSEILKRPEY